MKAHHIPNLITLLRIALVWPILWLLTQHRYAEALALFLLAGFSDALDGFLAKHYGWSSRLGGILDPIADKLLLMGSILTLGLMGILPLWLVVLVILRDVVIMGGALSYHWLIEPLHAEPTLLSKFNTLVQLALVLGVIVSLAVPLVPDGLLTGLIGLTGLTTVASGMHYVWDWSRRARRRGSRNHRMRQSNAD